MFRCREQPGTLVSYFFVAKGLISPFVVFLKTWSLLIWKYLCVQERRDSVHCSLKFALFTLLNSHTSFSAGQNDSSFLYNHQCTHPQGFSKAGLMIAFLRWKMGRGSVLTLYQPVKQPDFIWTFITLWEVSCFAYLQMVWSKGCDSSDRLRWSTLRFGISFSAFWNSSLFSHSFLPTSQRRCEY